MTTWILFAGALLVVVAFGALLIIYRTALFGLNVLNFFVVWSATMTAFIFGNILGMAPDAYSTEEVYVISYSIGGLLAMLGGIYLGWRPLLKAERTLPGRAYSVLNEGHFNLQLGLHTFYIGLAAELAFGAVHDVPTLSTAVSSLAALDRLGLFILLINALCTRRWFFFLSALVALGAVSIAISLATGSTFLRIYTLIPLLAIWYAFRGFSIRNLLVILLSAGLLTPLVTAWLDTRILIRDRTLDALSQLDRAVVFFQAYFANISYPTADSVMSTILARVDMTDILVEQVLFQPEHEPYAYGETVYSSFYTLIPRIIWEDKPEIAGGSEFVSRFTGAYRPIEDTTSIGLPYPFELYANGGAIAVIVGLGLIGYIGAKMELNLTKPIKSLGAFWASGLVTIVICEGGQRTDVVLPSLVAAAIAAYAAGRAVDYFLQFK